MKYRYENLYASFAGGIWVALQKQQYLLWLIDEHIFIDHFWCECNLNDDISVITNSQSSVHLVDE